jgi:hypothetical protein
LLASTYPALAPVHTGAERIGIEPFWRRSAGGLLGAVLPHPVIVANTPAADWVASSGWANGTTGAVTGFSRRRIAMSP